MRKPAIVPPPSALLLPVLLTVCTGGCVRTHVTRVARFEPQLPASTVLKPAPRSDTYKVKYATTSGGMRTHGGTKRIMGRGDALGFAMLPDGGLVAVAGEEQIPLCKLPPSARYCVWTAKEKRPTQFSKEVGKAAATAGALTLYATLVMGEAYLDPLSKEGEGERCEDKGSGNR